MLARHVNQTRQHTKQGWGCSLGEQDVRWQLCVNVQDKAGSVARQAIPGLSGRELVVARVGIQAAWPCAVEVPLTGGIADDQTLAIREPVTVHQLDGIRPAAVPRPRVFGGKAAARGEHVRSYMRLRPFLASSYNEHSF